MFINFSNHPSNKWKAEQRTAAQQYSDEIYDIPFPDVSASATERDIAALAEKCVHEICEQRPSAVLCQGEMTLTYLIVKHLIELGIPVLAACSERRTVESQDSDGNTQQFSIFTFKQFRRYGMP